MYHTTDLLRCRPGKAQCTICSMTREVAQPPRNLCTPTAPQQAQIDNLKCYRQRGAADKSDCEGGTAPVPPQAARQDSEVTAVVNISKSGINDIFDAQVDSVAMVLTLQGSMHYLFHDLEGG